MLFDTSSPGRKRTVQVIFAALAILMGGGLVLFGVGSATGGGGLVDGLSGNNTSTAADQGRKDVEAAEKVLAGNPKDVAAAERLARGRLAIANEEAIDPATGQVAEDGQPLITAADNAWTKYLALAPTKPNGSVAAGYASFYASGAVARYDKAARALETNLTTREPSAGLYAQLSVFWLFGGSTDKYQTARERAIELADSDTRKKAIRKELDEYKKQYDDAIKQQAQQAEDANGGAEGGEGGTTPKLPSLPSLGG